MNEFQEISLFPLKVVLFPGGRLDLQIFEQRYIDLVSSTLRNDTGFGICLLKSGEEVIREASRQTVHRIGTYCHIVDWDRLENGLLGITVQGVRKFKVEDCWQSDGGVLQARVLFNREDSTDNSPLPVDDDYDGLVDLLQSLENHPMVAAQNLRIDYNNLREIGWRLGELLPIDVHEKQQLLEIDDSHQRLEQIEALVANLANNT
ncbi:MAG: LON peptidase substrate-binding domain-containing protein [Pseudohongiellaceae bacterium]